MDFKQVYLPDKIKELEDLGFYIWRHKHIGFNNCEMPKTLDRKNTLQVDNFDLIFLSRQDFQNWYRSTQIWIAELDQVLNYCKYFVRENGNVGYYEGDGKKCRVLGDWDGHHINTKTMKEFRDFLVENKWLGNWFELHERYQEK